MFVRLIYASCAVPQTNRQVKDILIASQLENPQLGLSGALFYNNRFFLQVLEGDREAVNATYNKIARDPRHHTVTLLAYTAIDSRLWHDWGMLFISDTEANRLIYRHFGQPEMLNPFNMNLDEIEALLVELTHQNARLPQLC